MTNDQMLQRVYDLALYLSEEDGNAYRFCMERGIRDMPGLGGKLATLTLDLKDAVAQDAARASGRGSARVAANRIIKNAICCQPRESLHGAWMQDGKQCICDGYHAVILDSEIPGLPQVKEDMEKMPLESVFKPLRAHAGARLSLPTTGELKAAIRLHKAEEKAKKASKNRKPATWDFGKDLPTVNAEYLLDMLELLPGCTATVSESRPISSTIYFQAEGVGEGCLCPTRKES